MSSSTSSHIGSCALDWNQYFTILIIQSLCCQFFDIFALSFLTSAFCVHGPNQLGSEILCLGLRQFPFWCVLTITFDSSWSNFLLLLSHLSLIPDLKHCVPFFSTCCTSTCFSAYYSPAVGFALLCSRVLGSLPWRFLFSRPFGSCFIQPTIHQPTIHPLGLKASGVHDHCKRRRSEHRISNLLNTLNVKELQKCYDVHSAFKHTLHFVTRLATHVDTTVCQTFRLKRLAKHSGSSSSFGS